MLDTDPLSHERLDAGQTKTWEEAEGQFTVGTALETDALINAWGSSAPTCSSRPPRETTPTS